MPTLPSGVDLEACLFGGQAFTWWTEDEVIEGLACGTHVRIDPAEGTWSATPERSQGFLEGYLGADRSQPEAIAADPLLGDLARQMPGLRLLEQDPWEAFLAFMISPANNVPRIQATIARLCHRLGAPTGADGGPGMLPDAKAIAQAGDKRLRELGLGFRAPRVQAAAQAIVDERLDLHALAQRGADARAGRGIEDARSRLMELDGIGPKVAECVLCYALGFDDAFPVDRWVARAGEQLLGEEPTPELARQRWGSNAAIAQQVIFHGARKGLVDGIEPSPVADFEAWRSLAAPPR